MVDVRTDKKINQSTTGKAQLTSELTKTSLNEGKSSPANNLYFQNQISKFSLVCPEMTTRPCDCEWINLLIDFIAIPTHFTSQLCWDTSFLCIFLKLIRLVVLSFEKKVNKGWTKTRLEWMWVRSDSQKTRLERMWVRSGSQKTRLEWMWVRSDSQKTRLEWMWVRSGSRKTRKVADIKSFLRSVKFPCISLWEYSGDIFR